MKCSACGIHYVLAGDKCEYCRAFRSINDASPQEHSAANAKLEALKERLAWEETKGMLQRVMRRC